MESAVGESRTTQKLAEIVPLETPVWDDKIRFVCISDTHSKLSAMTDKIPGGDVLLHAGDFCHHGFESEIVHFNEIIGKLPHKYKIVIAGNHDRIFDPKLRVRQLSRYPERYRSKCVKSEPAALLTNCTYLQDSAITVYGCVKVYGSPYSLDFDVPSWAFTVKRGEQSREKWNEIPDDTAILLTHTPPLGHGDMCKNRKRGGCAELLRTVQTRVRPKFHVFGHVHEDYGISTDGQTVFINAAICDRAHEPVNQPILFDYPLPDGKSKKDY